MPSLAGRVVVLGVTGGISAYKAAELCRLLRKAGARVRVVMTDAACEFITPLTMQTLSGEPVARDLFDPEHEARVGHIALADEADVVVVAPATADAIARFAGGRASDLLSAIVLATRAPVLLAPAMNVNMWENALTQGNLARLLEGGRVTTVGPDAGELACGWIGAGRLVDPAEILAAVEARLAAGKPLLGRRVVVTAGPTHEPLDDVRVLANRSSGKMGFALAASAAERGADVTLIAGPVSLPTPDRVRRRIDVETAADLGAALAKAVEDADVVVMAAAVADFRPVSRRAGKLSRRAAGGRAAAAALALVANPDLLADLARRRGGDRRPYLVGFAAESRPGADLLVARARAKLREKGCDALVANDVGAPGIGFGSDRNAVTLVFRDGPPLSLTEAPKRRIADAIWDALTPRLAAARSGAGTSRGDEPARARARHRHLRAT